MNKPKVSICIPAYNSGGLIYRALESLQHQTHKNIEVIISDDGSTDETARIVQSYLSKDKRIKFFRNNKTLGVIPNYMKALEFASGEFIQFLGQDDWLGRNYLETALRCFEENNSIGAVFTKTVGFTLEGKKLVYQHEVYFKSGSYSADYIAKNIYRSDWGSLSFTCLFRRSDALRAAGFILKVCGDPGYGHLYAKGFATDWIFALKAISRYSRVYFCKDAAYIKLGHSFNAGKSFGFSNQNANDILRYHKIILHGLKYAYEEDYKSLMHKTKVPFAVEALSAIIFNFTKMRRPLLFFSGFQGELLRNFFSEYSLTQKALTAVYLLPALVARGLKFLTKSLKVVRPDYRDDYLVRNDGEFIVNA